MRNSEESFAQVTPLDNLEIFLNQDCDQTRYTLDQPHFKTREDIRKRLRLGIVQKNPELSPPISSSGYAGTELLKIVRLTSLRTSHDGD